MGTVGAGSPRPQAGRGNPAPTFWPTAYCLLVVGGLALAMRLAFGFRAPPFVTNDSLSYVLPGFDLARGADFAPMLKRPPLYPAFIGSVIALFGEELRAVVLVQHLLGVVTALCAAAIGQLLVGRSAGLLAGLLTAMSGPLLVTEQYLMSEALFGTLLASGLLAFLIGVRRDSARSLGLAGLTLGLAALTRPIGQLAMLVLVAAVPLLLPRWRRAIVCAAVLIGCFALTVLPWMARNQFVHGTFAIAGGIGEGLAVRTIRYDQQFDFREPPGGDADRTLARARRIYRDEAKDGSAFELARRLRDELSLTELQADGLMREIALGSIVRQPGYYLEGTLEMVARTFAGRPVRLRQDWTPWRNISWPQRVAHLLPAPTPAEERSLGAVEALAGVYDPARFPFPFILALFFALGALSGLAKERRSTLLVAILVPALLLAGAALVGLEYRYRYPLDPLINVIAAAGLATSVRWAARLVGSGQWALGSGRRAARADARTFPEATT